MMLAVNLYKRHMSLLVIIPLDAVVSGTSKLSLSRSTTFSPPKASWDSCSDTCLVVADDSVSIIGKFENFCKLPLDT